jgi:lysophospholipase L1-like esterase
MAWIEKGNTKRGMAARTLAFTFYLLATIGLEAVPFRLLTIGDSLSEEYRFEAPFSAPDSDIFVANVKNWVELLQARRSDALSMGGYEPSLGNYADFRNAGYELNYGIPGFKAERWDDLLHRNYSFPDLIIPENALALSTRYELLGDLNNTDAVLIFVGGNDLSLGNSDTMHDEIRVFIGRIHDYVRANAPTNLPIIVATVPDIGATPAEKLSDPVIAAAARQRVAILNENIVALGSRPHTYVARIDSVTDRIQDQVPFHINGTVFTYPPDDENPPLHLFCKDGFHPGTAAQALITNEILKAINSFAATPIPLLSNREILADLLGQNPDQPLIDYIAGAPGDGDGDGLPALIEYLLGTDPGAPNSPFTFSAGGSASYTPSATALRYADLSVLQSATLTDDWAPVPGSNILALPGGSRIIIPTAPKLFYKFLATPKP